MFFTFIGFDPKNSNHLRNINNTDKFDYNCGGYALGTFSWYTPFDEPTCIDLETPDDYEIRHFGNDSPEYFFCN